MKVIRSIFLWLPILAIPFFTYADEKNSLKSTAAAVQIIVDAQKIIGPVNRNIFGQNVEAADPRGIFRPYTDKTYPVHTIKNAQGYWDEKNKRLWPGMAEELKKVGATMMRYPGGCLTHNFDWRKTVGPLEQRANPEWHFGLDEFIQLCRQGNLEPVITVSVYVLPAAELSKYSADLVEYLNAPARPEYPWAMKRKEYGHPEPYGVKYFELGNETNHGNHKVIPGRVFTAEEYVAYARKTATAMREIDPGIKIGLNLNNSQWDKTVLRQAGDLADFWVKHIYNPPLDETMDARNNTIIATSFQPRVEKKLQELLCQIKTYTHKEAPLAITEYNSGGRGQLRHTYLAGYVNAQMIQLFLEPKNNVLMANYWHLLNDWWGILLAKDGATTKRYAPMAFFQTWAKFLGDEIIETKVQSPLLETPDVGGWGASTKHYHNKKKPIKSLPFGNNIQNDFNTSGIHVKFTSDRSVKIRLEKRDRDLYANFCEILRPVSVPMGEPIVLTLRFQGRFLPTNDNVHKAGMGLGMVDSRGWEAVKSATRVLGTGKTRQWKTFEKTFITRGDCPGVYLVARLETVTGPISGVMQFKDIEVFLDSPQSYPPFPAVTATTMLSRDKASLTMILFNKTLDKPTSVNIRLKHFNAVSAEGLELYQKDVKSTEAISGRHFQINVNHGDARIELPPCSMTAIRFHCKPMSSGISKGDTPMQKDLPERVRSIRRVLIVGNSLTKHGPSTKKLGWPYNWGMAATALENDYAHQLYKRICDAQNPGQAKPELKVETMLAYAIHVPEKLLEYRPDYVVLQMGDNLKEPKINRKDFVEPYIQLVNAFKKANPDAIVVIVGLWGQDAKRNALVRDVAKKTDSIYVDLKPLYCNPKNSAHSEGHFTHPGVNWHPGNLGMQKIAEQIWNTTVQDMSEKE